MVTGVNPLVPQPSAPQPPVPQPYPYTVLVSPMVISNETVIPVPPPEPVLFAAVVVAIVNALGLNTVTI